jgi:hypothetical protein
LDQPYEILNETGLSALVWQSEGVYVFRATVVDPEYRLVISRFLMVCVFEMINGLPHDGMSTDKIGDLSFKAQ